VTIIERKTPAKQHRSDCKGDSLTEPDIPTHTWMLVFRILQRPSFCPNSFGENLRCDWNAINSSIRRLKKPAPNSINAYFLAVVEIPMIVGDIDLKLGCKAFDEIEGVAAIDPKPIQYVSIIR